MMKFNPIVHSKWKEGLLHINRVQGVCLFPVSKNANTSLRYVLGTGTTSTHAEEDVSRLIKVAVVRDPADRIISSYLEILKLRKDSEWEYTMELPFYRIAHPEGRFRRFLEDIKDNIYDPHLLPQVYQIYRSSHVDYWILFEDYQKDLDKLVKQYNLLTYHDSSVRINKTEQSSLQERLREMMRVDWELRAYVRYEMYPEDNKLYNQIKEDKS